MSSKWLMTNTDAIHVWNAQTVPLSASTNMVTACTELQLKFIHAPVSSPPKKINNIKLSLRGKFALFCRPLETNKQIPPWEFMIYDFIITCGGSAVAYGYRHHNSPPCRSILDLTNYCPMIPISCLSLGGLLRSKIFHQLEHNYPIQDGPHMPQKTFW